MAEEKSSRTKLLIGAVAVLVIIGTAFWLLSRAEESRQEAFARGYYKHSYEVLEGSSHDIRVELVRTALIINSCESHNQLYCTDIERNRERLMEHEMPEKLDEGDAGTYRRATDRIDWQVMLINNTIKLNDYYFRQIHLNGIDEELAGMIETTVQEAQHVRTSLYLAEEKLISAPDNAEMLEALEQLEAAYSAYETPDLPTGWDVDDIEAALDELREARSALDELVRP